MLVYLEERGVLAKGTPEEIAAAKRDYRKLYQRTYKVGYRRSHVEVSFSVDTALVKLLTKAAEEFGIDRSMYAKEATLARLTGRSHGSDMRMSRELLQKVALIHSEVRHLCRQRLSGFLEQRIVYDRLAARISALEEALREKLRKDL